MANSEARETLYICMVFISQEEPAQNFIYLLYEREATPSSINLVPLDFLLAALLLNVLLQTLQV